MHVNVEISFFLQRNGQICDHGLPVRLVRILHPSADFFLSQFFDIHYLFLFCCNLTKPLISCFVKLSILYKILLDVWLKAELPRHRCPKHRLFEANPKRWRPYSKKNCFFKRSKGISFLTQLLQQHFEEILKTEPEKLHIIDFFGPYCGPCREVAPQLKVIIFGRGGEGV